MDELQALLAERACTRLINEYAARLDTGRVDTLWELFTEDGIWEMPRRYTFRGRSDLREVAPAVLSCDRRITMHFCTNVIVDVVSAERATGHCYFINHRADFGSAESLQRPGPSSVPRYAGEYFDEFVVAGGRWLIAHRRVAVNFAARDQ